MDKETPQETNQDIFLDEINGNATSLKSFTTIFSMFLVIVGFIAIAWFALQSSKVQKKADVPLIRADSSPSKVKPAEPGGMVVPYMDKNVYHELGSNQNSKAKVERILPAPEEPMDKMRLLSQGHEASEDSVVEAPVIAPVIKAETEAKAEVTPQVMEAPVAHAPVQTPPVAAAPQATVEKKEPVDEILAPITTQNDAPLEIKPLPKNQKFTSKSNPLLTSGYMIQLASFKSEADATATWPQIQKAYKIIAHLTPRVEKKEIESKGVFYRLQAGDFSSESTARLTCQKLIAAGQSCFVVKKSAD